MKASTLAVLAVLVLSLTAVLPVSAASGPTGLLYPEGSWSSWSLTANLTIPASGSCGFSGGGFWVARSISSTGIISEEVETQSGGMTWTISPTGKVLSCSTYAGGSGPSPTYYSGWGPSMSAYGTYSLQWGNYTTPSGPGPNFGQTGELDVLTSGVLTQSLNVTEQFDNSQIRCGEQCGYFSFAMNPTGQYFVVSWGSVYYDGSTLHLDVYTGVGTAATLPTVAGGLPTCDPNPPYDYVCQGYESVTTTGTKGNSTGPPPGYVPPPPVTYPLVALAVLSLVAVGVTLNRRKTANSPRARLGKNRGRPQR